MHPKVKTSIANINLDNLPSGVRVQDLVDSPRSLEAFNKTGILPSELNLVDVARIEARLKERDKISEVPKQILQLRIDAAERNRRNKLKIVC